MADRAARPGDALEFVVATDLERDGMALEVHRDGRPMLEVFLADADGTTTITLFVEAVPVALVEAAIEEARRRLPPREE